ncbi:hypothetical protein I311_02525 [Cryptococcus gattii NT-10]|nr:hypothetical protein I311_02525 [Cryptococcus gattii NT-10]
MQLSATNNDASEKITSDDIDGFQVVTQVVTEKSATPATETDTLSSETRRSDKDGTPDTIIESVMKLRISSPEFKDNHGRGCPHRRDFHCHHKHFYGPRGFMGPPPGFMPFGFDRLVPPEFAVGRGFSKHYKHGKHGNKFAKGISGAGHKHRHHRAYSPPFFEEFKTDSGPECHKKRMKAFFGPHGHHGVHHDRRHHKHASDDEVAAHEPTEKQLTSESNSASLSASDFETDSAATICGDEEKCARLWALHGFRIPGDRGFGGRGLGMAHHRGMKGLGHGKRRYMGPMGMDMGAIPDRGFDNEYTPHSPPFVPESEMSKGMRGRHFPRNFGRSGGRGGKHGCSFDPMGGMGPNAFFGQDEYPKHMPMHDRYHGSPPPPPEFMSNEQGSSAPLRPHPTAFLRHPASFRPHPNHFGRYHAHHGRRGFGGRFAEFGYETSGASPAPTAATT